MEFLPGVMADHTGTASGHTLLWTLPWDGNAAEALTLNRLHPLYMEVCRRIRLRLDVRGQVRAMRTSTKAARVEVKSLNGITGEPWALVDHRDKKGDKVLTLPGWGFTYKRVAEYLTSADYDRPALLSPTQAERHSHEPLELVARAMVRGQGKTEGYHERWVPVRHRFKMAIMRRGGGGLDDVAAISQARIEGVGKVQRILSHAIQTLANRGDSANSQPEHRERA
ncbi:MAG: hypothetical protein OXE40_13340 [Gammaproteobacteria bacterium]|nr:hypothetical protein [Gammaproteobacteria bacterium]